MGYYIEAEQVSLEALRRRIEETDLVPSRLSLLDGIQSKFQRLSEQGLQTLADLRRELKTPVRLESLSARAGLAKDYLVLLRREIESYFPAGHPLRDFAWLPQPEIEKIEQAGLRDTAALYQSLFAPPESVGLARFAGIDPAVLDELRCLVDLTRIQWVSPTAAAMLLAASCSSVAQVARADPEALCQALARVNAGGRFFKGKIGLRDVKRLVHSASFLLPAGS